MFCCKQNYLIAIEYKESVEGNIFKEKVSKAEMTCSQLESVSKALMAKLG